MPGSEVNEAQAVRARKQSRNGPSPSRHSLKCAICNHPDRAAIEFDFLNWRNPGDMVQAYRFRGLSTIYRHAHATGLFTKRRLNLRFAMERIVERVNEVPVTANAVIRAARAVARINDAGEWVDPPSRVIVTHINSEEVGDPAPHRPRRSKRNRGQRGVRPSVATRHSPPYTVFDEVLLDEPSDSASCEPPRINGKPPDPEIVLEIAPSLYEAVQARREAAKLRLAPWSNPEFERLATARYANQSGPANGSSGTGSQPVRSPGAASTDTIPPISEASRGTDEQSAGSSSSSLPQAAHNSPATARPEQGRGAQQVPPPASNPQSQRRSGPPLGSSGSANPPFPFDPPPLRQWKPRRRF